MEFEDHLGKAAESKHLAKQAIRDGKFDDAWGYLHDQKMEYLNHANRERFTRLQTLTLDSVPHIDMANILRIEGKYLQALTHLSYAYKTHFESNGLSKDLSNKLNSYFNRAYKEYSYDLFLKLLETFNGCDFESIRNFVEIYFPQSPALLGDDLEEKENRSNKSSESSIESQNIRIKQTQSIVDQQIQNIKPKSEIKKHIESTLPRALVHGIVNLTSPIKEKDVENIFNWNRSYFDKLDPKRSITSQCPEIIDDIQKLTPSDKALFWRLLSKYFLEYKNVPKIEKMSNTQGNDELKIEALISPLSDVELKKIDVFIQRNIKDLAKLSFEFYENIRLFQPRVTNFEQYLSGLTVNEKTRSWFYLFTNAKKARSAYIAKQGKDYPNPNYSSDMTAKPKLKGEVIFGLIILAIIFSFAIYKFVFSTNDYDRCVANGIQYYKDIGSYPMLKSENISATSKAKDNCSRSKVAFGDID